MSGNGFMAKLRPYQERITVLEERVRELEADKERLDWLEGHNQSVVRQRIYGTTKLAWHYFAANGNFKPVQSLREAIDATRNTEAQS